MICFYFMIFFIVTLILTEIHDFNVNVCVWYVICRRVIYLSVYSQYLVYWLVKKKKKKKWLYMKFEGKWV